MITKKVIKLPLNEELKRYLSSEHYLESAEKGLSVMDLLYNYPFHMDRLIEVEIEAEAHTEGFAIDATAHNPVAAVAISLLFVATALKVAVDQYTELGKDPADKMNRCQQVFHQSEDCLDDKVTHVYKELAYNSKEINEGLALHDTTHDVLHSVAMSLSEHTQEIPGFKLSVLNFQLRDMLAKDKVLKEKYESLVITDAGELELTAKIKASQIEEESFLKRAGNKAYNVFSTLWLTLGISSFVYWILWMSSFIFTGHFAPVGVYGLGDAGFAIAIGAGALYPLIKIRNWWRHNFPKTKITHDGEELEIEEDPRLTLEAADEAAIIFQRLIWKDEEERLISELENAGIDLWDTCEMVQELDNKYRSSFLNDEKISFLGQDKWQKSAAIFLAKGINAYLGAQGISWIVTDIIKAAFGFSFNAVGFSLGFGIAFMVGSAAYGLYAAYQKKAEVENNLAQIESQKTHFAHEEMSLEKKYAYDMARLTTLKNELAAIMTKPQDFMWLKTQIQKMSNANFLPPSIIKAAPPESFSSDAKVMLARAYEFLGGAGTGIKLVCIATLPGAAIFVPFGTAILTAPLSIGILIAVGIVYGAFKLYLASEQRKTDEAVALLKEKENKVECMQAQIKLAVLQIKLLENKKAALEAEEVHPEIINALDTLTPGGPAEVAEQAIVPVVTSTNTAGMFYRPKAKVYSADDLLKPKVTRDWKVGKSLVDWDLPLTPRPMNAR